MNNKNIKISFEFFPPKNAQTTELLNDTIKKLEIVNPDYVSVTYGAAGSSRDETLKVVKKIQNETNLRVVPHLTCIGSTKEEIKELLENYAKDGIKDIVALRGDLPEGYIHPEGGYNYASELVTGIKEVADFNIMVAGYPEKHPEAKSMEEDIDNLKAKIDAGANKIITQFFFDNNSFYDYLNLLEKKQIKVPVVPGILPIYNFEQMLRFAKMCEASIPKHFYDLYESNIATPDSSLLISSHIAINQCQDLLKNGIDEFHIYTLNRSELTLALSQFLSINH